MEGHLVSANWTPRNPRGGVQTLAVPQQALPPATRAARDNYALVAVR